MQPQIPKELGYQIVNGYAKPMAFVYEDNIVVSPIESKSAQPTTHYLVKIKYPLNKGMHWFLNEVPHPFTGLMPDPMDWFFINQAKRLMAESLKILKSWQFFL